MTLNSIISSGFNEYFFLFCEILIQIYVGSFAKCHLAFMRNAGIETIVQVITFKVDVFWDAVVEGVAAEVVAVQLPREVRVVDVVLLGDARQQTPCLVGDFRAVGRGAVHRTFAIHSQRLPHDISIIYTFIKASTQTY